MPYRVEYASSARAGCKGPMPCKGTKIGKGELRVGTLVEINGKSSFAWRHWGCVTEKILSNMKDGIGEAKEFDGYEELKEVDQQKIEKAFEVGHVADEDIPDSARKPEGEEKPKKAGGRKKKTNDDEEDAEDEEKPKPKKKAPAKKKAAPKKKKKQESDDEAEAESSGGEEFPEMDGASGGSDEEPEEGTKKRKRAPAKAKSSPKKTKRAKKSKATISDDED